MTIHSQKTFRLRGIPEDFRDAKSVRGLVRSTLGLPDVANVKVRSVAHSPYDSRKRIATLDFIELPPTLADESRSEWEFEIRHGTSEDDDEDLSPDTLTFDTHFVGFTPLHRSDDGDCSIDCVALSGLNGHAFGSFKKKAGLFMWLRDGLPIDIPAARILIYGYDTKLVNSASFQNLQDLGRSLFMSIQDIRTNATGLTSARPLVLIGHSLGGLVIKEGIISLDQSDEADQTTLHSIRSIYFFGVPHEGMAIESLVPLVRGQPNEALLHTLDKNSVILKRHRNEFPKVLGKTPPEMISFYETMKSPTAQKSVGRWRMDGPFATLVDTSSATSGCKKQYPINRDHSDMVKFLGRDDGPYQTVVRHFRNVKKGSGPEPRSAAKEKETEDRVVTKRTYEEFSERERLQRAVEEERMRWECLQSLAFPEQDSRMTEISPNKNTCNWLLRNSDYKRWNRASRGMVWVKGKPGAGKSTIVKYAYEESLRLSQTTNEVVFGFFIHGRGATLQKTPLGIFRALLNKILHHPAFEQYLQELAKIFGEREQRMGHHAQQKWSWTEVDLRKFLASVLPRAAKLRPVTLYIDALDELGEEAATKLVDYLENLLLDVELSEAHAKICFSCRNYPIIRLDDGSTIHVNHHNFADVSLVVRERLAKASLKPVVRARLENEIAKGARGVFQWAILVVRRVVELSRRGTKAETIMNAVRKTPTELDDLYTEILGNICENERPRTLKLLQWVCFAARPLELDEMRYAMATDAKMSYVTEGQLEGSEWFSENIQDTIAAINHLSRGLIEVTALSKRQSQSECFTTFNPVQFIHQSVADYILRSGLLMLQGTHASLSTIGWGHYEISRSCLKLISMRIGENGVQDKPLSKYALNYIPLHLRCVEDEEIIQKDLPMLLVWMNDPRSFATLSKHSTASPHALSERYELNSGSKIWHAIAAWGIASAVDSLRYTGDPHTTSKDANGDIPFDLSIMYGQEATAIKILQSASPIFNGVDCDTVLHLAVKKGMSKLIPLLLQRGANVHKLDKLLELPLTYAVRSNKISTVRTLLECGAQPDMEDFRGWTALHHATSLGFVYIVQILLTAGASPHPTENEITTPIVLAALNGQRELVKILFEAIKIKATPHSGTQSLRVLSNHIHELSQPMLEMLYTLQERCANYKRSILTDEDRNPSPLSLAARHGDKAAVRLLLLLGCPHEVLFQEDRINNRSPLSYAAQFGHEEIAAMLLPRSDVERTGISGRTSLMYAIENRHLGMIQLLLTAGNANPNNGLGGGTWHTALTKAVWDGDEELIRALLSSSKLDVDPRKEDGVSHMSFFFGSLPKGKSAAKRYIRGFIDMVKQLAGFPMTPILFAATHEKTGIAKMLLGTGRISIDSLDEAYIVAEAYGNVELMELFQGAHGRSST